MNDIILMQIIDPLKDLFKQTFNYHQPHSIYGLLLSDSVYLTRTLSSKFARSFTENDASLILSQGKNEEDINLLAIFHHQNRWVIDISPNSHLKHVDDVRMLKGTQEGDFSDCCDGRAIAFFRGIDPDCFECYDCAGAAVAGTAHRLARQKWTVLDYSEGYGLV